MTEAGRRKRQRCRSKPKALGDLGGVVKLEIYGWICNGYAMDMQWICNGYAMDMDVLFFSFVFSDVSLSY